MLGITTNEFRRKVATGLLTLLLVAVVIVAGEVAIHVGGFMLTYPMPGTY